jgi:hypothetical protein
MRQWNTFLERFRVAQKAWDEFSKTIDADPALPRRLPIGAQKIIVRVNSRVSFERAIPELMRTYRLMGGIDYMVVPQKIIDELEESLKPKKTKEEDDA